MSNDVFTLFSTAHISRDEYMNWLHQLNAVMIPEEGGPYDARLSKDVRHVWVFLQDDKWFDLTLAELEDEPEVHANIRQLLGGEPKSAIELAANAVRGSKILVVQFTALCAEHYPCVVEQAAGHALFSARELLELRNAGKGFDGSTWETAHSRSPSWNTRIIEEANKHEDEKKRALQHEDPHDDKVKALTGFDAEEHDEAEGPEKY